MQVRRIRDALFGPLLLTELGKQASGVAHAGLAGASGYSLCLGRRSLSDSLKTPMPRTCALVRMPESPVISVAGFLVAWRSSSQRSRIFWSLLAARRCRSRRAVP